MEKRTLSGPFSMFLGFVLTVGFSYVFLKYNKHDEAEPATPTAVPPVSEEKAEQKPTDPIAASKVALLEEAVADSSVVVYPPKVTDQLLRVIQTIKDTNSRQSTPIAKLVIGESGQSVRLNGDLLFGQDDPTEIGDRQKHRLETFIQQLSYDSYFDSAVIYEPNDEGRKNFDAETTEERSRNLRWMFAGEFAKYFTKIEFRPQEESSSSEFKIEIPIQVN